MSSRFERERLRHEPQLRRLRVARTARIVPDIVRITLAGPELEGFAAPGPADHVKVFFPDPVTGALPEPAPGGGRPEGVARDYTPLAHRPAGAAGPELDLDFVLHPHGGPASAWAAAAVPGDELLVAGPRGSALPPAGIDEAVIIADESGLPAARRWLESLSTPVTALLSAADPATSAYLAGLPASAQRRLRWCTGDDRQRELEAGVRELRIGEGAFVFLAGEAGSLIPIRRYLRRELGLPKSQVDAHGYWKRGVAALDHHAPIDPADPD